MRHFLFALLIAPACVYAAGISYSVEFEGVTDSAVLRSIKATSELASLKKHLPASINALRYRAESDLPEIQKILRAHGYYEAQVETRIEEEFDRIKVIVQINPGPVYQIEDYEIALFDKTPLRPIECNKVDLKSIGIELGKPAIARKILDAEQRLLTQLSMCGYPLAEIDKREILADGQTKTIRIKLNIDAGPVCRFGKVDIQGTERVNPQLICQKLCWQQGDPYNSALVESTQKNLIDSGLFTSVIISHDEQPSEDGLLAIKIDVTESKHRSINLGASYQTYYGPGITFGWENRNVGGLGRKLSIQGDATKRSHSGIATYLIPDFRKIGQDYLWQAQALHEHIIPYSQRAYLLTNRLERKIGDQMRFSVAGRIERLFVTGSAQNGNYVLLAAPLYFRLSSANNLLNPTRGATFEYKATPTLELTQIDQQYLLQQITQSFYYPLSRSESIVLAQKFTLGSIVSETFSGVPLSKRFYGGSEEDLRGYRYFTVSPLADGDKPIGGRSAFFYSLEFRLRLTETIGLVPFFDLGNVYKTQLPTFEGKWFKSTGLGFRYFTFFGPLRVDVGFPLMRRKVLDPYYRILVSIGQAF
jgi:translocation and assembly module TamA